MIRRQKTLALCVVAALSSASGIIAAHATPASSANYVENGLSNQHHSYIFEQSTDVLLSDSWDVRYADNRFRNFPIRYSSYKHEPRWSAIYDDWGERFGVAVLVDVRSKQMILTWADEFKIGGLHYVMSGIKHENARYGWDSLIELTNVQKLEHEFKLKQEKIRGEEARKDAFDHELLVAKRALENKAVEDNRRRDAALFQAVYNLEKNFELKRNRLSAEFALKQLELAEIKQIHAAKYAMDSQKLQDIFDKKVSDQNSMIAKSLLDMEVEYRLDTKRLNEERDGVIALKNQLTASLKASEQKLKDAKIVERDFIALKNEFDNQISNLQSSESALEQRQLNLDDLFKAKQLKVEKLIQIRTQKLAKEVSNLKSSLNKEHESRMLLVQQREDKLSKDEAVLAGVKETYFPNFEREIGIGSGQLLTKQFLKDNWHYKLHWNDDFIDKDIQDKIKYKHKLTFAGASLEDDLEKMVCHLGAYTADITINAVVYRKDQIVSIRFDKVNRSDRNKFLQQCKR